MCARLWPVGRPASRPRAPVEATHEGSLQLHTRHHIVDRGAGGTVSRSIRERFPGTRRGSLHDYEGSRFSGGSSTFTHCGTPVPFSGTQTRIHFCNGALRRRPPTQLPHSVRTCATSSHLAHAPPHHITTRFPHLWHLPVATGWQPYTEPYTPPRAFIHAPNVKVPRPHAYRHARPHQPSQDAQCQWPAACQLLPCLVHGVESSLRRVRRYELSPGGPGVAVSHRSPPGAGETDSRPTPPPS